MPGRRQIQLLRLLLQYGPLRSIHLWDMMYRSTGYSETRISHMLCRLEDLGLVDADNDITELGRKTLDG